VRKVRALLARIGWRRALAGAGGLFVLVLGVVAWRFGDRTWLRLLLESPQQGRCKREMTRAVLDRSLELGTRFMLVHQKAEGNFDYEYDWRERSYSPDDNEVRQAGALWGLGLLYRDRPSPELGRAVEKGLAFFERQAVSGAGGARCFGYLGRKSLGIGAVALIALAYIEYLSTPSGELAPALRAQHESRLRGYLQQLVAVMNADGLWPGQYEPVTCRASGEPSPYSDGEALLALVKAAKYLGRTDLLPVTLRAADDGYRHNVKEALAVHPDSDTTKGYYQWSTMAFYELATSGWPGTERFGNHVLELADWQIDVHRTLMRERNTAYAYEGLIPAYDLARRRGDAFRQAKYGCVIDLGLGRLTSWQVGGPLATRYTGAVAANDRAAVGGVQNEKRLPALRIDVVQHQMHAVLFARELVYR
jgi:UDP-N-acetylmuramoyl-tripeptide--D-alanyl-D-alanine ligase